MVKAVVPLLAIVMSLFSFKATFATDDARAHDLTADDRAAIEFVIREQLMAFRTDDAEAAFGYAAPRIRQKLDTPAAFLDMVRRSYAPAYRPRSVEFGDLTMTGRGPVQTVFFVGSDNAPFVAHYEMERQPDGQWKIAGCFIDSTDVRAA